jgi:F420-dependent oxidoreductase-like protein
MQLGLTLLQHQLEWREVLARARFAEEVGFDSVWVFDHFKPNYHYPQQGEEPDGPCLESWTLLSALAALTTRIRLGVLVSGVTYRHPSVLSAQVVTVDHISGGRLDFGIGAGWFEKEHRELGIPFPPRSERLERLEEAVQVIKILMTKNDATFEGRYYILDGATYLPRPIQQPHPPVWIGAGGQQSIPIAARHADVWHTFGSINELRLKVAILDNEARKVGRDPSEIARATALSMSDPWDETAERVVALKRLGFSHLVVPWPSGRQGRLEEFMGTVWPNLVSSHGLTHE